MLKNPQSKTVKELLDFILTNNSCDDNCIRKYQILIIKKIIEETEKTSNLSESITSFKNQLIKSDKEIEKNTTKSSSAMNWLTTAIVFLTIAQVFVGYWQYKTIQNQSNLIHEQNSLTKGIWKEDMMRKDRAELREANWRREDIEKEIEKKT